MADLSPAFWQSLLAAEIPAAKAARILESIEGTQLDPLALLRTSPELTAGERSRLMKADPKILERWLELGAEVVPCHLISEEMASTTPAVWVQGASSTLFKPIAAIVGTRSASTYGKAAAHKFAEHLSRAGFVIASGGALGIDAAAHRGAIEAGGETIAVKACGLDVNYPAAHAELFKEITRHGCLMSPFALGTPAGRNELFMLRNHLIAAMASCVLVIEAPEKSGALATARSAAEFSKEVFVVPSNITNPNFRGSHSLIRDGATLVDHPDQILDSLGVSSISLPTKETNLAPDQQRLMDIVEFDVMSLEDIVMKSDLDAGIVMAELTELEMLGLLVRDGIGYARRP